MNKNKEVEKYITSIKKFLVEKYTTINDEWLLSLALLQDNLYMFFNCKERIKKDGLMITNRFGVQEKHPLIKVQNDAQIQIIKLINEFGLSPKSLAKIKTVEQQDTADEFIKALCNG